MSLNCYKNVMKSYQEFFQPISEQDLNDLIINIKNFIEK